MIQAEISLIEEIKKDAAECYPNECCGIMFGSAEAAGKTVTSLRRVRNSFGGGEEYHRFLITPEEMLSAELYARSHGLDIVGFYHSHPDCPAVPSEYDRARALPVYSYVIVSAEKGTIADIRSYELENDIFHEEKMIFI